MSYDANGNRTGRTVNGVAETYSVDNADKLTSVTWTGGSKTYGYDAAGRTTSVVSAAGTTTLAYDFENRVTSVTLPGGGTNSYAYNGLDTRVTKVDSTGTKSFMRNGVDVVAPVLSDSAAVYTPGISERRSGTTTYTHTGFKDAETQSSTAQAVTATRQYDAFGNVVSSTGTWNGPFGYCGTVGYQDDSDTGLKLLGHRYYDSSTGRFLTRDKAKDGRNWYVYCDGNPVSSTDADGQIWSWVSDAWAWLKDKATPTVITIGTIAAAPILWAIKSLASRVRSPKKTPKWNPPGVPGLLPPAPGVKGPIDANKDSWGYNHKDPIKQVGGDPLGDGK